MSNYKNASAAGLQGPVQEQNRIMALDILRGVALLGILLMNIAGMGLPEPAYIDPSGYGGDTGWNLRVFFINSLLFEGTMRGIFSMLFGAGVILFTKKKEEAGAGLELADAWYKRTIWLIAFGLFHAYILVWNGDILFHYGIVGLFLFPARNADPRRLIGFAVFVLVIITALNINDSVKVTRMYDKALVAKEIKTGGGHLTASQQSDLEKWEEKRAEYKPDEATKEEVVKNMRAGYFSAVKTMAPISQFMQTTFFFRHGFLDVLSMMLLGMGLFKLGVFQAELKTWIYAVMVFVGYAVGLTVNWFETNSYIQDNFSVISYYKNQQTYDLGRIFTTMGHVGLVMLFAKSSILGFLKRSLAAVGRMALTNYIMHTVIATTVFGIFRQFGQWERYQLYYLVLAIWVFQLIMSPIWLTHFRFGPLEWLWRWLTYGKRPAFRRAS
jgi:uncharacterized protein